MSLEAQIAELNTNIVSLIAALAGGKTKPAANDDAPQKAAKSTPARVEKSDAEKADIIVNGPKSTLDDVKAVTIDLAKLIGKDAVFKILGTFNATRATELTPDQYDDYVATCKKKLAAAA